MMEKLITIFILLTSIMSCQSQTSENEKQKIIGGPCQGCEAILEFQDQVLMSSDTLPDYSTAEIKLNISGTVFLQDGKTPAEDVIVYIYHTNRSGIYEKKGDETGWGKKHGYLRGWIKTDQTGKYSFHTFRPGAYPNGLEPEHIHFIVKEPNKNEYYIDDIFFDDDPLLTQEKRSQLKNRAGSGIVKVASSGGQLSATRNIYLGQNIPNYR